MNSTQPIQHILVAHDFQENSDAALDYALSLAKKLGSRITVLHSYEIPSLGAPEVLVLATDWPKQFGVVAREALEKVVGRVSGSGVAVQSELRQGAAWREVDGFAKENQVDLIVVGSHGRHGVPRALLGSVAEKSSARRLAPCSSSAAPRSPAERGLPCVGDRRDEHRARLSVFDGDRSPMGLHGPLAKRQAEAAPAAARGQPAGVELHEGVENLRPHFGGNAGPLIAHANLRGRSVADALEPHDAPLRSVPNGVFREVDEHPEEQILVSLELRRV